MAIDPGVRHAGISYWKDSKLVEALLIRHKHGYVDLAQLVFNHTYMSGHHRRLDEIIIEKPRAYSEHAKQKGDQNDLIELAIAIGQMSALLLQGTTEITLLYYYPDEWKKQMPKEVTTKRIKSALSSEEMAVVDLPTSKKLQFDVWDGVGIGLYHVRKQRNPSCSFRFVPLPS